MQTMQLTGDEKETSTVLQAQDLAEKTAIHIVFSGQGRKLILEQSEGWSVELPLNTQSAKLIIENLRNIENSIKKKIAGDQKNVPKCMMIISFSGNTDTTNVYGIDTLENNTLDQGLKRCFEQSKPAIITILIKKEYYNQYITPYLCKTLVDGQSLPEFIKELYGLYAPLTDETNTVLQAQDLAEKTAEKLAINIVFSDQGKEINFGSSYKGWGVELPFDIQSAKRIVDNLRNIENSIIKKIADNYKGKLISIDFGPGRAPCLIDSLSDNKLENILELCLKQSKHAIITICIEEKYYNQHIKPHLGKELVEGQSLSEFITKCYGRYEPLILVPDIDLIETQSNNSLEVSKPLSSASQADLSAKVNNSLNQTNSSVKVFSRSNAFFQANSSSIQTNPSTTETRVILSSTEFKNEEYKNLGNSYYKKDY